LTKLLPLAGFEGSIRPEIAGSTSLRKLESRLGPKPEENQAHSVKRAEAMKAFSAQKIEFYWVWSQRPLCYPLKPVGQNRSL